MFNQQEFKFDCKQLLDEIELAYQDLCDMLELPYQNINQTLMRKALSYLLEDAVNYQTSAKFRQPTTLTKNLISSYLEHTVKLDNVDVEDIENLFVKPLMEEAFILLGKLLNRFDRFYSNWKIEEGTEFPTMGVVYLGDFRIDEWHRIQDVPSSAVVAVKQHRIRKSDVTSAIREALCDVQDVGINDIDELAAKIFTYYTNKQVDELYKDIVMYLKVINNTRLTAESKLALKQCKNIIKILESIPSFKRFIKDLEVAENIYHSQTNSREIFDLIMPNKYLDKTELRNEILQEIDENGFVKNTIPGRVEILYG